MNMENNHICPKCNSTMAKGTLRSYKSYYPIQWKESLPTSIVNLVSGLFTKHPTVFAYKCTRCGYIEQYVEVKDDTTTPPIL